MAEVDSARHFERQLSFELSKGKFEETPQGGMIVHDVKALAEGVWTDSAVGTPLFYPKRTLERDAANWINTALWSRHSGGVPRRATDKVGMVKNPHYNHESVTVDLHLHGLTQMSRDVIALVKSGDINWVSVEHTGDEAYNPATKRLEAESLQFHGLALVDRGACKVCTIRDNSEPVIDSLPDGMGMETKELEAKIAALEATVKELGAVKTALEAAQAKIKELSDAPKTPDTTETVKALDERVKKLEAAPAGTKTTVPQTSEDAEFVI